MIIIIQQHQGRTLLPLTLLIPLALLLEWLTSSSGAGAGAGGFTLHLDSCISYSNILQHLRSHHIRILDFFRTSTINMIVFIGTKPLDSIYFVLLRHNGPIQ